MQDARRDVRVEPVVVTVTKDIRKNVILGDGATIDLSTLVYPSLSYFSFFSPNSLALLAFCVTSNGNKLEIVENQMIVNTKLDLSGAY